jgi:hypothetical protein
MQEPTSDVNAQTILEGLFAAPPRSAAALRAQLAPLDPAEGRRRLLARLHEVGAPPRDSVTMLGALGVLGLGEADLPAIHELLVDPRAALTGRAVALALLSALAPSRAQEVARSLAPGDLMALNDAQLTTVLASMPTTPARVTEITQKLARQAPGARTIRLGQIERIRRRLGIPAALLYRDALEHAELGLDAPLLELVMGEGGQGAAIRFEQLWRASAGAEAEARWAQAVARLYQVKGRASVEIPRREAWVSALSSGATALVLRLESAVDGSFTLASIRLAAADAMILDGTVVSLASPREADEILGQLESSAKASLAEVSARVETAAQKARSGRSGADLSSETFAALCFFSLAGRLEAAPTADSEMG